MSVKRPSLIVFVLLVSASICMGQPNLVLNPSFEQNVGCSTFTYCASAGVNSWNTPTGYTPDWFNPCDTPIYGSPSNGIGYQIPHSGQSYAGVVMYSQPAFDHYEYITGRFVNSLKTGRKYCINFYVSLADSAWYATTKLGAYVSSGLVCNPSSSDTLPYVPQIYNPISNVLSDKINWVPISGQYISSGGEKYITIGSFDSITQLTYVGNGGGTSSYYAYYYIDDVSVREVIEAHAGKDTNICGGEIALIGTDSAVPGVSYYWQPTTGLANPNSPQTLANPSETTTYTLTVVNDSMKGCNCPDSVSSSTVTVNVCKEPLFVPNAFSPNNDGQNDILQVKGNYVSTFDLVIYDRWGNRVFESQNIDESWDGTYKGKPEDAGTYVYYLKGTYTDGTSFDKKGSVELVR